MNDNDQPTGIELYFIRHAHAGSAEQWTGADELRPLSDKGIGQAERLGVHLALLGFSPDVILSSPKLRALQTAEIVAAALGKQVKVDDRLADEVELSDLDAIVRDTGPARRPVLVGHDPDFSQLVTDLTGAREIALKKGALARIDVVGEIAPVGGTLRWLLPPDLVPRAD